MKIFLFRKRIFDNFNISFLVYPEPVGFEGELRISHLVFFEIAFFNFCGVSLNPSFSSHFTNLGFPPASRTMSGYETQYGAGIITSSPLLRVAMNALYKTCFPPVPTVIWFVLYERLFSFLNFLIIAFLSAGVPSTAVYFVSPDFIAFIAALLMLSGVSKSGSPAPKPITSFPAALSSLAFWVTAIVGEGLILFKLLDIMLIEIYFYFITLFNICKILIKI